MTGICAQLRFVNLSLSRSGYVSMWFLGLVFKKAESAVKTNVDLTHGIQSFTDTGKALLLLQTCRVSFFLFQWKLLHKVLPFVLRYPCR